MNAFIYVRGCGVPSVDGALYEALKETALNYNWKETTIHIDQNLQPLFYPSGVCPIYEVMKKCDCDVLLVAGADHLSIDPIQLMRFNVLLMEDDKKVYLQLEHQFLHEWVYEFKLLQA